MDTDPNSIVPTRAKLSVLAQYAPTEEERDAAKRLLAAGRFRESTPEEDRCENHPFFLVRDLPNVDGLELTFDGLLEVPPSPALLPAVPCEAPVPAAPTSLHDKEVRQDVQGTEAPASGTLPAAPVVETLEDRTSLKYKFEHLDQNRNERQEQPPMLRKVEATKPSTDRTFIDW